MSTRFNNSYQQPTFFGEAYLTLS